MAAISRFKRSLSPKANVETGFHCSETSSHREAYWFILPSHCSLFLMQMQPVSIPVVQIRPNLILIYPETIWPNGYRPHRKQSNLQKYLSEQRKEAKLFDGKAAYSGQLTLHSRKRLQKSINLLVAIASPKRVVAPKTGKKFTFKVNFVTLTLPSAQGKVLDIEIKKKCIDLWIKAMRRKHQLKSYVWRAERQYNGNVHFHITTDTYLPQDDVRNEWNRQLGKFHFIDEFHSKHKHRNPNSTDVHAVWKIRNIAAYMVKYMSKDPKTHLTEINAARDLKGEKHLIPEDHPFRKIDLQPKWDDPISGKVWDCSQNLKSKERCVTELDQTIKQEIAAVISENHLKWKDTEHCTLIFMGNAIMEKVLNGFLLHLYLSYLSNIKGQKMYK